MISSYREKLYDLSRGGVVIKTSEGPIQYGASPETIKDTMLLECGVPRLYLIPDNLFLEDIGISIADLEFPIYYNFFFFGRKITIFCSKKQIKRLKNIIKEAIFGPSNFRDFESEFLNGNNSFGYPDLKKELEYFRKNPKNGKRIKLSDLVIFKSFENDLIEYGNVKIKKVMGSFFNIFDNDKDLAIFPSRIYMAKLPINKKPVADFIPPEFGFTIIGSGTGFDPDEMTSGFILWINKNGILVDPPVNSTLWLRENNISSKMVKMLIITHCHADHDAGTLQKILDEGRVKIVTTPTIKNSFVRKYSALLDMSKRKFEKLFDFIPITIGEPVNNFGCTFLFKYSLHSVPTLMFEVQFGNKSLFYSGDHANNPPLINEMYKKGVLTKSRYDDLINFSWDYDVILHETGVPPIHTPIDTIVNLPDEVKNRIKLVHVDKKNIKKEMNLSVVKTGIENTFDFEIPESKISFALQILEVLMRIDFVSDLKIDMARRFLELVKVEKFKKNEIIIEKGSYGKKFYMILEGVAGVSLDKKVDINSYGKNDYFGETAIILNQKRNAYVIARSDMTCITVGRADFINFAKNSSIISRFKRIAKNRERNTWELLESNDIFSMMTNSQKTDIQSFMKMRRFNKGDIIFKSGDLINGIYLIDSGEIILSDREKNMGRGELVGVSSFVSTDKKYRCSAKSVDNSILYFLEQKSLKKFLEENPGVLIYFEQMYNGND